MRVLVVGGGGREHALVWKLAQSPRVSALFAAPGNAGMVEARCLPDVSAADAPALLRLVRDQRIELVVIGPEQPLADGLGDQLREAGVLVFGPGAAAAKLEASKSFARAFMQRHGIPHPRFACFSELPAALSHLRANPGPCVVKADGLAAGKGVVVCDDATAAEAALGEMMRARRFGAAGDVVLIEERLQGVEASYYAITDGTSVAPLAAAQDYKRALAGDRGENTGGMGAFAPTPVVSEAVEKRVLEEIVHPTIRGMREEGAPMTGVLYVGLMISAAGEPRVVEFNVRFGDPETQPLLFQMEGDLLPLLEDAARGELEAQPAVRATRAAVCVVLASEGYPRAYQTGKVISGIEAAESDPAAGAEGAAAVKVFHAGTQRRGGELLTAGGRVLGVTARGANIAEARARAYAAADCIHFEGRCLRRDIAAEVAGG